MKKNTFLVPLLMAGCLIGCNESTPEPNAASCGPALYSKTLNAFHDKSQKSAFAEACRSFQKANDMRTWDYKPSPADDF